MKKYFYILIGILVGSTNFYGQIKDTRSDLEQEGINGKVEIVEEYYFSVKNKLYKDSLKRAYYSIYSEEGYIVEKGNINIINKKRIPELHFKLKYNAQNQIEGQYRKNSNDSLIPVVLFKYDSLNRIIETTRFYTNIRGCSQMPSFYVNDGGNEIVKRTYLYNEKGSITKYNVWAWHGKEWKLQEIKNIKEEHFVNKGIPQKKNREYNPTNKKRYREYNQTDEFDNWTLYTEYYKRKPIEIIERKLKYYKK